MYLQASRKHYNACGKSKGAVAGGDDGARKIKLVNPLKKLGNLPTFKCNYYSSALKLCLHVCG